jgi:hypothetical protein
MKTRTLWVIVAVVATSVLLVGVAGAIPFLSGRDAARVAGAPPPFAPEVTGSARISYQGRLTSPDGTPLSGTYTMRFQIFDSAVTGTSLWDSGTMDVGIEDGLFNVALGVKPADFKGQPLWLQLWVDGESLSPRQELMPVPYALSLRPGAQIVGAPSATDEGNSVLHVNMTGYHPWSRVISGVSYASGTAIYGQSYSGLGVFGNSAFSYGVWGSSFASWGGYFQSDEGYGIRVDTNGRDHWDHAGYFTAEWGNGVFGQSTENYGVRGEGKVGGVRGDGQWRGVSGHSTNGEGVLGSSSNYAGVQGSSSNSDGVRGQTFREDDNYGFYTWDNLYSKNYHTTGAMMRVVQNADSEPLERGDVVVIAGLGTSPAEDANPLIQVRKAREANSTAVIGVVASSYSKEWLARASEERDPEAEAIHRLVPLTGPGPIAPGEYLLIVVQGPCQVKVDATAGAIQPGDLLSTAGQAAHAARALEVSIQGIQTTLPGTVFGKALEPLEQGEGLVYVYVTLQ